MSQHGKLNSIPEYTDNEDEITKWVPKKKHDVLKVKYKCLKKLFQIYDASVIGVLPEQDVYQDCDYNERNLEVTTKHRRKKRSHRTKTDACAGTTEVYSGDTISINENQTESESSASVNDLETNSSASAPVEKAKSVVKLSKSAATQFFESKENEGVQTCEPLNSIPYLMVNEKRKLTRFQCFIHKLLGLNRERIRKNYVMPNGHVLAASDNDIVHQYVEKRRRRTGLRFRRLRRPKKINSEGYLGGNKSTPFTYIQSVQRNCLLDTTPRQCPIAGCGMMFYGIINYNDHLNLVHFTERKFFCLYCHEGFEREHDKFVHENSHLGISKLEPPQTYQSLKKVSITQTEPFKVDVQDEKLKKIVSFFDKIAESSEVFSRTRKNPYSESNLQSAKTHSTNGSAIETGKSSKTVSCMNIRRKYADTGSGESDATSNCLSLPVKCHFCGETFDYRRQLSLHVDLEHRIHGKFSKFHSCMGIVNTKEPTTRSIKTEEGFIGVGHSATTTLQPVETSTTLTDNFNSLKSEGSLSCDPSTNIIYYSSTELVNNSKINNFVQKVRGIKSYQWEPETKIIRV